MAEIDYYKTLQDQNYKELLDREIQLDSARQRALRNTNTNLAAAGMDSSGLGALAQGGVENQYLQGLNQAQNTYQDRALQLQQDQYNNMNNQYTGFIEKLSQMGFENEEQFNNYLSDRGFLNEDGTFNEEAFNNKYGSHNYNEFLADMNAYRNSFANEEAVSEATANSLIDSELDDVFRKPVKDELNFITSAQGQQIFKNLRDGDCIMVADNLENGNVLYLKAVTDDNGNIKLVKTNEKDYKESKGRYYVASGKNSKGMNVAYNDKYIYSEAPKKLKNWETAAKILLTALTGGIGAASFAAPSMAKGQSEELTQNYKDYLDALKGND